MTVQSLPWSIHGQSHHSEVQRNATAAAFGVPVAAHTAAVSAVSAGGGHGVVGLGDLAVTQNGTPNMSVNVAAGRAVIRNGESASILGASYTFLNDATVNVAISTADGTNPRIDLVIAQVRDANYSGASNDARLTVVTGTPAASPAVPSLSSYPNCLVLAQVAVGAGVSTILTANITDKRTWAAALGGVMYSPTVALLPPVATVRPGTEAWVAADGHVYKSNGTVWIDQTIVGARQSNTGTTTSTSYTATLSGSPGTNPSVSLQTGTSAKISVSGDISCGANYAFISVAVSGASTIAAADSNAAGHGGVAALESMDSRTFLLTGLTAGINTFTLQYRVNAGTGSFLYRDLTVEAV